MEKGEEALNNQKNWSEAVEDLMAAGDTNGAISLLETHVSKLKATSSPSSETVNLQLVSALNQLSKLRSTHNQETTPLQSPSSSSLDGLKEEKDSINDDDDWEAIADRAPSELLISSPPSVSNLSLEKDAKVQAPKRRGRGTFSYKQDKLYSDRQSDLSFSADNEDEDLNKIEQQQTEQLHSKYGTRHVLVLADFPPSTRTIELEKLFQDFTDRGVVIRWVSDTVALAAFQTPSTALEAQNHVQCPFKVRILDEDDVILSSIPLKDLEPPRRRPQTSTRTAQRLIAQGMGLKLPSTGFGSRELKNQEEARKNRIGTRQKMIEDAWGDDKS